MIPGPVLAIRLFLVTLMLFYFQFLNPKITKITKQPLVEKKYKTKEHTKASYLKHLGTSGYIAKKGKEHGKTDVHYPQNICCKRGSKFVLY
jgi:hypothetical protein